MTVDEFKKTIPGILELAIDLGNSVFQDYVRVSVDIYCLNYIDQVVDYLHNLWLKDLIDNHIAWNASKCLGTLAGEALVRHHNWEWSINDDNIPVVKAYGNTMSPITKIFKIITEPNDVNDSLTEGSVISLYTAFLAMLELKSRRDTDVENN